MLIRAITALLGVAFLCSVWHFFKEIGLVYTCAFVTLVCCFEFSFMVEKSNRLIQLLFVCITFAFYCVFTFFSQSMITFISFFILLVGYFILCSNEEIDKRVNGLASWTVGLLYCGALTGIVTLGINEFGGPYFTAVLILSFITDTFAYLGGRAFGKNKLAPKISPKKTVEGSISGLIGGSAIGFYYLTSITNHSPTWVIIVTCIAGSLFGQVGDLFESTIKRYSGVKDSGKIMPGHGGFLDRIDGVLFVGPVIWLWMQAYT